MPKSSERSGIAYALGAYITWGFLTIYWKFLNDFNAFELIGWRIVTSAVVLLAILAFNKQIRNLIGALQDKRTRKTIGLASIMLSINWTTYVWAVVHDHVLETALGYFIAPIFTMLLGFIILREPVRASHRIIILLTTVAITILTYSYGQPPWRALLIATSWSSYFNRTDSVPNMATGIEWVLVLLTGLMTAIPLLMFGAASRRVRLSVLGPMQFLVPTFNFLLGWLVYNEELNALRLVGFAFVWVGLAIFFTDSYKSTKTRN